LPLRFFAFNLKKNFQLNLRIWCHLFQYFLLCFAYLTWHRAYVQCFHYFLFQSFYLCSRVVSKSDRTFSSKLSRRWYSLTVESQRHCLHSSLTFCPSPLGFPDMPYFSDSPFRAFLNNKSFLKWTRRRVEYNRGEYIVIYINI